MYGPIEKRFRQFPARRGVVMALLRYGLRIDKNGKVFCGDIELSPVKIGRAVGCDRRVVIDTAKMISEDRELLAVFSGLRPTAFVGGAAKALGFGLVEIRANPNSVGLVARVSKALADENIVIRQIVADDPDIYPEPKLSIVAGAKLSPKLIVKLQSIKGIERISLE
ncbi:MAG: amino acid-binding ACT domain protein [Candidatus Micrarchaeota archaeon]